MGYIKNFEQCFKSCEGDIIISCDADDVWFPNKVEKILKCFEEDDEAVYVYHDAIIVDKEMRIIKQSLNAGWDVIKDKDCKEQLILSVIRREGFPFGMTMSFRNRIMDQLIPFKFAHDEWIYMCALVLGKIRCINEPLTYYRRHGHNASGSNGENILQKAVNTPINQWFDWPKEFTKSYLSYLDRFGNRLPLAVIKELNAQINFRKQLSNVIDSSNKIKAIACLLNTYGSEYRSYRGNWKTLVIDAINVVFN